MATNLRTRIDLGFANLARIVFRHRLKTLLLVALIVSGLVSQLHTLTADNSHDGCCRPVPRRETRGSRCRR